VAVVDGRLGYNTVAVVDRRLGYKTVAVVDRRLGYKTVAVVDRSTLTILNFLRVALFYLLLVFINFFVATWDIMCHY